MALSLPLAATAKEVKIKAGGCSITLDGKGFYSSLSVDGDELLGSKKTYPFISVCSEGSVLVPVKCGPLSEKEARLPKEASRPGAAERRGELAFTMEDGGVVRLACTKSEACVRFDVIECPERYDALLFGPVKLNINEVVGDIIGVVQGRGVALGVQGMNPKSCAGLPAEYAESVAAKFGYAGKGAVVSTSSIAWHRLAATDTGDGAVLQFSCTRRDSLRYREVQGVKCAEALSVEGPDGKITGAGVAFFGCEAEEVLATIGRVEVECSLPHPLYDGVWGKVNRSTMQSYMITNFSPETIDFVIAKAKMAGFKYIYESDPFKEWGRFEWSPEFVKGGDEAVRALVQHADRLGIKIGIHTLSNFITTGDSFITPNPSKHLLKQGELRHTGPLTAEQTEIEIDSSALFEKPMTLNALQCGEEIITFGQCQAQPGGKMLLTGCTRGAFGTTASAHPEGEPLYKLWDYPYRTFFPDIALQDSMAARLGEIIDFTGIAQTSFDGLEGCSYTGQDDYATARFVEVCSGKWNNPVINDASNLGHYTWHIHSRMNWGEPWGEEMREGQVSSRIKNQAFFRRNLFPRMLGWFLIRLADKNFECTTPEDLEWAMSEAAGFDAGYAMTINQKTLRTHGQIDILLRSMHDWDSLRLAGAFPEHIRERLRDPKSEWHLERRGADLFLYPLSISKRYRCSLGELQPGQPAGADWSLATQFAGGIDFRLYVEGEGEISNPRLATPEGTVLFPCTVQAGQYLLYYGGKAVITDKNYNTVSKVTPQGRVGLPENGASEEETSYHVSFYCDPPAGETAPDVVVRFITRGDPVFTTELK